MNTPPITPSAGQLHLATVPVAESNSTLLATLPVSAQPANARITATGAEQLAVTIAGVKHQLSVPLASLSLPENGNETKTSIASLTANAVRGLTADNSLITRLNDNQALVSTVKAHSFSVILDAIDKNNFLTKMSHAAGTSSKPLLSLPVTVQVHSATSLTVTAQTLARPATLSLAQPTAIDNGTATLQWNSKAQTLEVFQPTLTTPATVKQVAPNDTMLNKALVAHTLKTSAMHFERPTARFSEQLTQQFHGLSAAIAKGPLSLSLMNNTVSVSYPSWQPSALLRTPEGSFAALPTTSISKQLEQQLPTLHAQQGQTATAGTATADALATEPRLQGLHLTREQANTLQQQIPLLARRLLADTGSTNQALNQLFNLLKGPANSSDIQTRQLFSQYEQLLKTSPDTTAAMDSKGQPSPSSVQSQPSINQLQALFSATSLPVTPASLSASSTPTNFVTALVSLLQLTLTGKAASQAAVVRTETAQAMAASTTGGAGSTNPAFSAAAMRAGQELASVDRQGGLSEAIKTLLANHQVTKLTNAEARLQGQEQFYFILPFASHNKTAPEVLIKREDDPTQDEADNAGKTRNWQLTMKLDIAERGQLLAKSTIHHDTVTINLYTSTDVLLCTVADTLPFLIKRLETLGLHVDKSSVQRGKIPEHLAKRPYQLFETRV